VAESYAPGAVVSEVARQNDISPQHLFAWRKAARAGLLSLPADEAPMFVPVVTEQKRATAPTIPIGIDLNNLAELLTDTNRLSEAEPLYRRALAISEKRYGADHPNVATGLNNLAELLGATNRLSEAEPLYRRAVRVLTQFTGAKP